MEYMMKTAYGIFITEDNKGGVQHKHYLIYDPNNSFDQTKIRCSFFSKDDEYKILKKTI